MEEPSINVVWEEIRHFDSFWEFVPQHIRKAMDAILARTVVTIVLTGAVAGD